MAIRYPDPDLFALRKIPALFLSSGKDGFYHILTVADYSDGHVREE